MPSIDGGGVEKNLIIIANYLIKISKVTIITYDKRFISKFDNKIKIVSYKNYLEKKYYKYFVCLVLLVKEFFKNKKILVLIPSKYICVIFIHYT